MSERTEFITEEKFIDEARRDNARRKVLDEVEAELADLSETLTPVFTLRHELFEVEGSELTPGLPAFEQLYVEPSYNDGFIGHDLGLRKGNTLDYHQTTESYDTGKSSENEKYRTYRRMIMTAAQERGFVAPEPGVPTAEIDKMLGILDSSLEPIDEDVAAIVINGAAALSNHKRVRDALRNIENGRIKTDRIIISAGTRPAGDAEQSRVIAPFRPGTTEFEMIKFATEDLVRIRFGDEMKELPVNYGHDLTARMQSAQVQLGDRTVTIDLIEAPFDTARTLDDGSPAKRINTEETFVAALPIIAELGGAVVIESHDTWTPWQNLIGKMVYGLELGRNVYPSGPFNAERIVWTDHDDKKEMDIAKAQDVVDEMAKTYRQLVLMQTLLG